MLVVSAASRSLQLLPKTLSDDDATAYPWRSILSSMTEPVLRPWTYHPPVQPPPKV